MKKELEKVFQIPASIRMEKIKEKGKEIILYCIAKNKKVTCKHCGGMTKLYDRRIVKKRHTIVGGKTIWLEIKKRRMRCVECHKVFMEELEGITRKNLTNHFIQQIQEKAKTQDFSTVGRETGISCATVSRRVGELPVPTIKEIKKSKFG